MLVVCSFRQLSYFVQVRDIVRTASGEHMIQWLDTGLKWLVRAACQPQFCTNRFVSPRRSDLGGLGPLAIESL